VERTANAAANYLTFAADKFRSDIDSMNDLHFSIFDNDILKIQALEKLTVYGYYATLDSIIRVAKKRQQQAKKAGN
jgi:hypothetical protein